MRELDWSNPGYFHRNQILRQAWKIGSQAVELYEPLRPGPMDKDILLPNRITVSGVGSHGLDTRALSTTTNFCKWSKDIRRGKARWIDEYSAQSTRAQARFRCVSRMRAKSR